MQKSEKTVVADENFALRTNAATDWGTGRNSKGSSTSACVQLFNEKFFEQISKQILSRIE